MSESLNQMKKPTNIKLDSWYEGFYGDWLLSNTCKYGKKKTLEECIEIQINYDKMIDTNQFIEELKYDISGRKEFIIENNSLQKNKELLVIYEQNQLLLYEYVGEEYLDFINLTKELIRKCFIALEQGYLITNQLFILNKWFCDESFEDDY